MRASKIRYKGYEWEHNPESLKITSETPVKESVRAFDHSVVNELGAKARVVTGSGSFAGENCVRDYLRLYELKKDQGSGILSLPGIKPFRAFFKSLELTCTNTPERLVYSFCFVEELTDHERDNDRLYYTVAESETLWSAAYRFSKTIDELVMLNPDIMRIDELESGRVIRIC